MAEKAESWSERKLTPREFGIALALLLAVIVGLSALVLPLFANLSNNASIKLAETRQAELIEVQNELKASTGSYADKITELSAALEGEGLEETAADLAQLTASSSGWCAVLNQERGRMSSLTLTVRSDGSIPKIFETITDATAACED